MVATLPRGVSALIDPADEPYLRLLEHCAQARRELGLPSFTRAELEALLDRGARSRDEALPANVIPFRPRRARPQ